MNVTLKNNRGKKAEFAKQALIRYIQDSRLQVGDKLPGHELLRHQLKLSGTTIFRAIQALRDEGVFEVRDKVGTFIKSADFSTKIGRSIGVLLPDDNHPSAFICMLSLFIQYSLIQHGCLPVPFLRRDVDQWKPSGLDDIPGLEDALLNDKLDGIIDLCDIQLDPQDHRFDHIPLVFVGNTQRDKCGVAIDLIGFLSTAMHRAAHSGFRRPALVASSGVYSEEILTPAFRRLVEECGFEPDSERFELKAEPILHGRYWAAPLLELPPEQRPDVLVLMDEYVGNDLLTALRLSEAPGARDYRPTVIVCLNVEQPMTLASDRVVAYRKSLNELACRAVDYLLRRLRGETQNVKVEYLPFEEMPPRDFLDPLHCQEHRLKS